MRLSTPSAGYSADSTVEAAPAQAVEEPGYSDLEVPSEGPAFSPDVWTCLSTALNSTFSELEDVTILLAKISETAQLAGIGVQQWADYYGLAEALQQLPQWRELRQLISTTHAMGATAASGSTILGTSPVASPPGIEASLRSVPVLPSTEGTLQPVAVPHTESEVTAGSPPALMSDREMAPLEALGRTLRGGAPTAGPTHFAMSPGRVSPLSSLSGAASPNRVAGDRASVLDGASASPSSSLVTSTLTAVPVMPIDLGSTSRHGIYQWPVARRL
jgi:hypothetical protein